MNLQVGPPLTFRKSVATFQKVLMCFLRGRGLAFHLWFYKVLPLTVLGHILHLGPRCMREDWLQPPCLSSSSLGLMPIVEARSRSERGFVCHVDSRNMLEGKTRDHFFVPFSTLLCYEMQIIIAL